MSEQQYTFTFNRKQWMALMAGARREANYARENAKACRKEGLKAAAAGFEDDEEYAEQAYSILLGGMTMAAKIKDIAMCAIGFGLLCSATILSALELTKG